MQGVDEGYAYFDNERPQWKRACEKWRPAAVHAATRGEFLAALEGLVSELHDDNVTLSERSPANPRKLPWETDLYAVLRDNSAYLDSVRTFGDADVAGVRPGVELLRIDDVPVDQVIRNRLGPGTHSKRAMSWAIRHTLAGPLSGVETLTVRDGQETSTLRIERGPPQARLGRPVFARRMGDNRDIGYLRVRIGADDAKLPGQFDAALENLTRHEAASSSTSATTRGRARRTSRARSSRASRRRRRRGNFASCPRARASSIRSRHAARRTRARSSCSSIAGRPPRARRSRPGSSPSRTRMSSARA